MSIKTLLFILFLYTSLVWVAAFRLHSGPELVSLGLLWTGGGLAALLLLVVLSWAFGLWKRFRSRPRPQKSPAVKPVEKIHPEDAAISTLFAQANLELARLSKAPGQSAPGQNASRQSVDFRRLPLYLLAGPEGCGKTSTFANSGVECRLLAGRVSDERNPAPGDLMNIWLAGDAVFLDIAGRVFSGPSDTWLRLLRALRAQSRRPVWKALWMGPEKAPELRGVVAFVSARDLIGAAPDPQRLDSSCRHWRERLRAVADFFEMPLPVWQVFTNADSVPFFPDYFARLRDAERAEVFGSAASLTKGGGDFRAESAPKVLTAAFREIYRSVASRRLTVMAEEPQIPLRAGIYEFPRELKKIRTCLVQFLAEAYRSDGTERCPVLRGFYFTAALEKRTRERDRMVAASDMSIVDIDASRVFRGDATRLFRPDDLNSSSPYEQGGKRRSWIFTSELFTRVIPGDRPALAAAPVLDRGTARTERLALAAFASLCVLIWAGWSLSWAGNRSMLDDVDTSALEASAVAQGPATLSALRSLERMRIQLLRLQNGPGVAFHMGLYSGNRVVQPLRAAYFRRFQALLLDPANARMVSQLGSAPATGNSNASAGSLYRILKTHLMISSGVCRPEAPLVSAVLKNETSVPENVADPAEWKRLAFRQIDFYSAGLRDGNPCRLAENTAATGAARDVLRKSRGVAGLYVAILANTEHTLNKAHRLTDIAPNYTKALAGPNEMSAAFSPQGWSAVEKASKERNLSAVDSCVLGAQTVAAEDSAEIQRFYLRDYIERWRKYLSAFSVLRYGGAQDAAAKLAILSDHNSPLLALFAMAARETDIKTATPTSVIEQVPILGKLAKTAAAAGVSSQPSSAVNPADLARTFQPVHWVVPPASETWITEKNAAYAEALAQLGHAMQDLASKTPDDGAIQAANQSYDKALDAARQIARGFKPVGVDGIDAVTERLLEEPVLHTRPWIPANPLEITTKKLNGQARAFCQSIRPVLHKYPFQSSAADDASLAEFSSLLAPANGAIWKFQTEKLADLVVKDGAAWKAKDPSKKPAPTQELLDFLNHAETIKNSFYPGSGSSPQFRYVLRPKPDSRMPKDVTIVFDVDGQHREMNVYQEQFSWPPPAGAKSGAVALLRTGGVSVGFASRDGLWGIFRMIGDAEGRVPGSKIVEWRRTRGMNGPGVLISPAPVRLEIVEASGGADVFTPGYFSGLQCPSEAAQ
jgi:type VI secretion system protein ImpL